ncbi:aminotransferase class V-fold PLP-dependent enzyme, partial [Chryseobacterium sp. SIMBA_029]|uniref:aminotransferase class V-fold PLP-dependent enzyme n=1 Tax=Chryseobacterium sp. SIMBA_029 TaxID=3085772 RepID=UPI00397E8335
VDAERVLSAHPNPKVIAAVHADTSVGVLSDIAALGAGKGDALLITDAVTSIGGLELRADDWGIDVGYAGTQKCLGVPPGLSPFT